MKVYFKKLRHGATTPFYATPGAAAADLYALCDEAMILRPGERAMIGTGLALELPSADYVALLFARSGLAVKHGLALSNGVGVIDADYRGEICVGLVNLSQEAYTIHSGERIAQIALVPIARCDFCEAEALQETARAQGGFGSTGLV